MSAARLLGCWLSASLFTAACGGDSTPEVSDTDPGATASDDDSGDSNDTEADDDDNATGGTETEDDDSAPDDDEPGAEPDGPSPASDDDTSAAPGLPPTPGERAGGTLGRFTVTLTQESADYATLDGKIYAAPVPSRVGWTETATDGDCRLIEPEVPSCAEACEPPTFCIADDNRCGQEPPTVSVGEVTVFGLTTLGMTPSITLAPLNPTTNAYNATGDAALEYPPFTPGAEVVLHADGGALEAFDIGAVGIESLSLDGEEPLPFTGEENVLVSWQPGSVDAASIEATVDVSFHGGTKGQILCDTDDDGELSVGRDLVTQLIELGVAGFPQVMLTRRSSSFANVATHHVEFNIVSRRTRLLSIPGVESCVDDDQCDEGQVCLDDSTCG